MRKFEELVKRLSDEIDAGTYPKGSRLPTTPELCEIYGVSNTTVKRAMDDLERMGLVARRRGSGVFVKEAGMPSAAGGYLGSSSGQMSGTTAEFAGSGRVVESVVRTFAVERPPEYIRQFLDMEEDEFAYHICRVRVVDGRPIVVEYTYMPISLVPGLREATLSGSIYGYLEGELGLKIGSAHRAIKAVMPTSEERDWLGIGEGEPLLEVRQVAFLDDGTPFEASCSRHTSDYEFFSISTR